MKSCFKKLLSLIIVFNMYAVCADELVNQLFETRSRAFSADNVSQDLLKNMNESSYLRLRGEFASEVGDKTGRLISGSWISKSKEYMREVNQRAEMDFDGAKDSLARSRQPVSVVEKPSAPDEKAFQGKIQELDSQKMAKSKAVTRNFIKQNHQKIEALLGADFSANKDKFAAKGLGSFFGDLSELADSGYSNPKLTRSIISQLSSNKDALAQLDISGLEELSRSGSVASAERSQIISSIDEEKRTKTNSFNQAKEDYPKRVEAYEKEVNSLKSTKPSNSSLKQAKLDEAFFKKSNLNPITDLSRLTNEERVLLLTHPEKPLAAPNSQKSLAIINDERSKQRRFIEQVRDLSNDISNSAIDGTEVKVAGAFKEEAQRLKQIAQKKGMAAKYRDVVNSKLHSSNVKKGMSSLGVTNVQSRLALLDTISGNAINPNDISAQVVGSKKINVKEMLDRIPASDMIGKKALAKYVLENGTNEQIRSLKIHASPAVFQVESDAKFKARCRQGGVR